MTPAYLLLPMANKNRATINAPKENSIITFTACGFEPPKKGYQTFVSGVRPTLLSTL